MSKFIDSNIDVTESELLSQEVQNTTLTQSQFYSYEILKKLHNDYPEAYTLLDTISIIVNCNEPICKKEELIKQFFLDAEKNETEIREQEIQKIFQLAELN